MYLKSITFSVSSELSQDFESWVKNETQDFGGWAKSIQIYKLLTKVDEESTNFSVQFEFESKEQLEIFKQLQLDIFVVKSQKRFQGKLLYFITLLEKI